MGKTLLTIAESETDIVYTRLPPCEYHCTKQLCLCWTAKKSWISMHFLHIWCNFWIRYILHIVC